MSGEELRKVEVLARVKSGTLRVRDAAVLLQLSYRQAKRLWKRYREEGAAGRWASVSAPPWRLNI
jgi:transposase